MRNIKITLILLTFFSCIQAQNNVNTPKGLKPNWKSLEGSNYSINYPAEWELTQNGQMGTSFILFSPLEKNQDNFKENVNLLIQNLKGYNIDLNKYVEISIEQIKTMITNSKIIESNRIKKSPAEFHHMIYTGDQGILKLKFEQYFWVKDEKAFILTLTCEQNKFSDYKRVGEEILNSFKFK